MNQSNINPDKLIPKPVLKPVLFSLLTLISGIIIGSGLTFMISDQFKKEPPPPGPEYMSGRMIEHLIRELHLAPEQREQLKPIVKQHMEAMDDIRREARPKIAEEIKQLNDGIMALLDEGQKQIWTDKIQRMQANFPRMRQYRDRGPGRTPRDRHDPNLRPGDGRPPRRFRNNRLPENRERRGFPPPPEGENPEESAPKMPSE